MAATLITSSSGSATATTSVVVTQANNTVTGDTIILGIIGANQSTNRVSSITMSGGTFTEVATGQIGGGGGGFRLDVWVAPNVTGATTPSVTVAKTATVSMAVLLNNWRGLTTSPVDKSAFAGTASGAAPAAGPTATLSQAAELVMAFEADNAGTSQTWTAPSGYTNLVDKSMTAGGGAMASKIVSSTAAQSATWTIGSATDAAAAIVTFEIFGSVNSGFFAFM